MCNTMLHTPKLHVIFSCHKWKENCGVTLRLWILQPTALVHIMILSLHVTLNTWWSQCGVTMWRCAWWFLCSGMWTIVSVDTAYQTVAEIYIHSYHICRFNHPHQSWRNLCQKHFQFSSHRAADEKGPISKRLLSECVTLSVFTSNFMFNTFQL